MKIDTRTSYERPEVTRKNEEFVALLNMAKNGTIMQSNDIYGISGKIVNGKMKEAILQYKGRKYKLIQENER